MTTEIPNDVKAYIAQAATIVAQEQNFIPENEASMLDWLILNRVAIMQKASALQSELLEKITKQQDKVTRILSTRVWSEINRRELNRRENLEYNAILN